MSAESRAIPARMVRVRNHAEVKQHTTLTTKAKIEKQMAALHTSHCSNTQGIMGLLAGVALQDDVTQNGKFKASCKVREARFKPALCPQLLPQST